MKKNRDPSPEASEISDEEVGEDFDDDDFQVNEVEKATQSMNVE